MKNYFMKYHLFVSCLILLAVAGCGKEEQGCMPVSPQAEEAQIKEYTTANGIDATKHSSGIYYNIVDSGSGIKPTVSSTVYVTYLGKFLDGRGFDSSKTTIGFPLQKVIEGWQIGIPLIKKGGKIRLIIPSSYAYGCNGRDGIPPNSVLYFDIELVDVQ